MQPSDRPFDDPAGPAEPAPVPRTASGELTRDAALRQLIAMRLRIVAAIALNQPRLAHGSPDTATNGGHRIE
jgi:hypothetical protein